MARRATLYDFRDLDLMLQIAEHGNGGMAGAEVAELLGFGETAPITRRLAWMRHYGMVEFDDADRTWSLSAGGRRVTAAHLRAPALRAVEAMPDEAAVEMMAHVVSRYQRGDSMLAAMLRREFLYGTGRR